MPIDFFFKPSPSRFSAAIAISVAASILSAAALAAAAHSTKDGAFTTQQAARGKLVYEKSCANCHQADFYRERLARWKDKSIGELFEAVSTAMPADNVGSLATSEYIDVLAYVFSITGSPAGNNELTTDTMDAIKIAAVE